MMPWGHFAVAYVPYALYRLLRDGRPPEREPFLVLLVATQFPDLVDKPLAWTLGVIPSGRMVGHSLVIAGPFVLAFGLLARRAERAELGAVFALGHLSHVVADAAPVLRHGSAYYFLPNLFWPLRPANPDRDPGFAEHVGGIGVTPRVLVGIGVMVIAWALTRPEIRRGMFPATRE